MEYKSEWNVKGCSIISDGWRDSVVQKDIVNFLVNSPKGSMFIKSLDVSETVKDSTLLFELLDKMVDEVGEKNVIQVVTDNASSYVKAGKLLMAKREHLYWTPCAAHCVDLILEDIGKLDNIKKALKKCMFMNAYIYTHVPLVNMMRRFTNQKNLHRPSVTKFSTSFITLSRYQEQKSNLRKMVTSQEWNDSKWSKEAGGKQVASFLLQDSFWRDVVYALKLGGPFVKVLRIVDGERRPPMGYIYEAMDRAKETIAKSFSFDKEYAKAYEFIDKRWDNLLHRPLHAAGYYLNPKFHYDQSANCAEVVNGFYDCLLRVIPNIDDQDKITKELVKFRNADDLFGNPIAIRQRKQLSAAEWWAAWGVGTPNLQSFAIKILSLTCSATGCERNWGVFQHQNLSSYDYDTSPISVGPWGGQSGEAWNDGLCSGIRQLIIVHGAGVDSIQIEYDINGSSKWSAQHGGNGGCKTDKIKFDYPEEYLTSIHGHYGSLSDWSPVFVRSITFGTNRKTYGPFGIEHGTFFSLPTNGIKIVGFHGRSGSYVDAIGAHLKPINQTTHYTTLDHSLPQTQVVTNTTKSGYSILQGSLGNQYDVVLALKQKDHAPMRYKKFDQRIRSHFQPLALEKSSPDFSRQSSSSSSGEFSDTGSPRARLPQQVPAKVDGLVTYGPWGGSGGSTFEDCIGMYKGIKHIKISRNVGLVSMRVLFIDHNGYDVWGDRQGGTGGFVRDKVFFDYPYEVLTHISGYYGPAMIKGPVVIKSITFHTTKTTHGPFGEEQGTKFSSKSREGKIVGFHGRKGLYIDAIGVHVLEGKVVPLVRPKTPSVHPAFTPDATTNAAASVGCNPMSFAGHITSMAAPTKTLHAATAITDADNKLVLAKRGPPPSKEFPPWGVMKEPVPCEAGPWGGDGGRPWDDGVFSGIKQIYLTRDDEAINSIQIEYDRNGQSVWSVKHGGNGGRTTLPIKLGYPNEVLTCISGYSSPVSKDGNSKVIRSLTFYTTRGKYGPYGEEVGAFFTSVKTEGKIVGLHGRSSSYLDAIGVHMQHWLGNQKAPSKPLFKLF